MRLLFVGVLALVLVTGAANCETIKSQVTASNGISVETSADEFANRYEYSAPAIMTMGDSSDTLAIVGKRKVAGKMSGIMVQGGVTYRGDWRFYNSAVFKGGAPANYSVLYRNVVSCTDGCRLREAFEIDLKPADVAKHAENGTLAIEIRPTRSPETVMLQIPVSYIDAVNEVAK